MKRFNLIIPANKGSGQYIFQDLEQRYKKIMYIERLIIKGYKILEDLDITLNEKMNQIMGNLLRI